MKPVCARLWQAEAVEDGRLAGNEKAAFERHAEGCDECGAKRASLRRLRDLAGQLPVLASSPFDLRRQREALLARVNQDAVPAPRRVWPWAVGGTLIAAAAALLLVLRTPELPGRLPPPVVATLPSFEIAPGGAEVEVLERGQVTRVALARGELAMTVSPLGEGQRFVVELPDGELEVVGTRFLVAADGYTTEKVVVHEGKVILRLEGQSERILVAPETYTRPVAAPAPVHLEPVELPETPRMKAVVPVVVPAPEPPAAPSPPGPGEELAAAMDAFTSGDFGQAEKLFLAFEEHHPGDARVEDAAYLRIVARARRGDGEGARELARDYLRRYPDGFRRKEAEAIANPPAR